MNNLLEGVICGYCFNFNVLGHLSVWMADLKKYCVTNVFRVVSENKNGGKVIDFC